VQPSVGEEPEGAEVVRALFQAYNEDRLDDMLRLVDTGALWEPATRPGRPFYLGRDGTMGLAMDMRATYGLHRVDIHRVEEVEGGGLQVTGSVVRTDTEVESLALAFTTYVKVHAGHILALATDPADLLSVRPSGSGGS
jgi:hypothetical protein